MLNKFLLIFTVLVVSCASVIAQEVLEKTSEQTKTKYEVFVSQPNEVVVTQAYVLTPDYPNNALPASVHVAWLLGQNERLYSLYLGGQYIDGDQLEQFQKQLDNVIQTINSFDQLKLSSVNYHLPSYSGYSGVNYYTYKDSSGKEQRNLVVLAGGSQTQSKTLEPLEKLRDVIAQARAKIASLQTK